MKLLIIGDRGIPARYSGFSTMTEQLAVRLVQDYGHEVTVYCRNHYYEDRAPDYRGVKRVFLPAPGGKSFESIIHSCLSIAHAFFSRYDAVFLLDPGNAPFALPLKLRGKPIAIHTDGLGWQRRKWSPLQQKYYKWSEKVSALLGTWLVTDARAMQEYYLREYRAPSSFIPYSGVVGDAPSSDALAKYGLEPGGYYLVVARLEPENNVDLIIREYRAARPTRPLVIVGGSPYQTGYSQQIFAESDDRVRCVGAIYESAPLNGLYANCYAYLHGHEVGGTNPSLLRAMQAGAPCIPVDVVFTREVVGESGLFFGKAPGALARIFQEIDSEPERLKRMGAGAKARATALYRWDAIAAAFATLFQTLTQKRPPGKSLSEMLRGDIYRPEDFVAEAQPSQPTASFRTLKPAS
jgi:glycosyltransferase involved in cell wall biosynthesis